MKKSKRSRSKRSKRPRSKKSSKKQSKTEFDRDLEFLIKNSLETDQLSSSVILVTFRKMLQQNPNNKKLRENCKKYRDIVYSVIDKKETLEDKEWCRTIVKVLDDALNGKFNIMNLQERKIRDIKNYKGKLKKYCSL